MLSNNMRRKELSSLLKMQFPAAESTPHIRNFLASLNCPRSLTIWLLFSYGEHGQLVDMKCDPKDYNSFPSFRDAYAATEFLSKAKFLKTERSTKEAAFEKFEEFELLCKHTNNRFRALELDPLYQGANVWLLNATSRKISQILGDYSADEFVDSANWGPGVSTLIKGSHVSAYNKFHKENGITAALYSFVRPWFSAAYPAWGDLLLGEGRTGFSEQVGNKIVTVPKNSKTDRVIAIEPGINLWFQKSIGTMIRRRLLRNGIDLTLQSRNQQLARYGSLTGSLATVDFSSASDSISREVVSDLIPLPWLHLMDCTRSRYGVNADGTTREWEKFSSMGNGFTFELESLIFFAAALAVCEYIDCDSSQVSVYGDDVIIPVEAFTTFSSFCQFLGFRTNPKKSFFEGSFRESCGGHYYEGRTCTPIYLKGRVSNVSSIFKLANSIRAYAHRCNSYRSCDNRFRSCWHHLYRRIPKPIRFGIPLGSGEGGFIVNFDEATPSVAKNGHEGYDVHHVVETGVSAQGDGPALLLARLWVRSFEECGNNYTLRGQTRSRISKLRVPQWYNLGPWVKDSDTY